MSPEAMSPEATSPEAMSPGALSADALTVAVDAARHDFEAAADLERGDADIGLAEFGQSLLRHGAAGMTGLKTDEARHIIAIGAQGVRRSTPFMRQRGQPVLAKRVGAFAHQPLMATLAFLASATKAARPLSVKG